MAAEIRRVGDVFIPPEALSRSARWEERPHAGMPGRNGAKFSTRGVPISTFSPLLALALAAALTTS
jgi:hypothetical protein